MRHVRWGIIGCGDVTEVKSGPGFQKAGRSSLVAVMRRDAAKAEDYARRHGVPRWYADADALVADPDVDAVYVATPPSSHHRYTILAARAGKPVYVEKPMALHPAECDAMVLACRDAGVPLFTAYYRRAMPRFAAIKRLVDDGAIGTIRAATISMFRGVAAPAGPLPWRLDSRDRRRRTLRRSRLASPRFARLLRRPDRRHHRTGGQPGRPLRRRGRRVGAFTFASGAHGTGPWSLQRVGRSRSHRARRHPRAHHLRDVRRRPRDGGNRRRRRDAVAAVPGPRPAAADPDHRR